MKLRKVFDHRKEPSAYSIPQAVEQKCDDQEGGIAENARDIALKTSRLLGALIERLHIEGVLKEKHILEDFLDGSFDVIEESAAHLYRSKK